jgi:predicted metal-dependent peptidase
MTDKHRQYFFDGRAIAMTTMPYLGGAVIAMSYIFDESVVDPNGNPTMAVTEKAQLLLHPLFVERVVDHGGGTEAIGFVVLHEVFHILFGHAGRVRRLREKLGDKFDARISGLAVDFTINPMLRATAKKRGKRWWIREPIGDCAGVFPGDYGLPEGLKYEDYYDLLQKQNKSSPQPEPRSGPGQGCSPMPDGQMSDAMRALASKIPEWSKVRAEGILRQVAAEAKKAEEKARGTVPAGLLLEVEELLAPPKVDWRSELFSQMCDAIEHTKGDGENSYVVPSRRQAGIGYGNGRPLLAGHVAPVPNIVVVWDTSGSMYGSLQHLLTETLGIAEVLGVEVTVISCDTVANAAVKVGSVADAKAALVGGGGTYMTPAFAAAKAHEPSLVVCITDGAIETQPVHGHGFQVLWVLVAPCFEAIKPSLDAGWGRHILITTEDMK